MCKDVSLPKGATNIFTIFTLIYRFVIATPICNRSRRFVKTLHQFVIIRVASICNNCCRNLGKQEQFQLVVNLLLFVIMFQ